jgi:FKBP-type peptidyl-prolyl cis-trans isomerase 2
MMPHATIVHAFCFSAAGMHSRKQAIFSCRSSTGPTTPDDDYQENTELIPRRRVLPLAGKTFFSTLLSISAALSSSVVHAADTIPIDGDNNSDAGFKVVQTSSGLKYIDLVPGTGRSPNYGELVSIGYVAYIKLPKNSKHYPDTPVRFDRQESYLLKHGNGRSIPGLDEGLHSMRMGGTRRILIPPKLGYVDVGLGPIPELPWNRWKLNQLLDQMVELSGGTVIYEVTLKNIIPDEVDLGYYQDDSLTPEQFATLRENLRIRGNEELAAEAAQASITSGEDRIL